MSNRNPAEGLGFHLHFTPLAACSRTVACRFTELATVTGPGSGLRSSPCARLGGNLMGNGSIRIARWDTINPSEEQPLK
jgi:hypothetical protein